MMMGKAVESYITLIFDLTSNAEQGSVECVVGCGYEAHPHRPYIGSPACDRYPVFLSRIRQSPYTITAVTMSEGGSIKIGGLHYPYIQKHGFVSVGEALLDCDTDVRLDLSAGKKHEVVFYLKS